MEAVRLYGGTLSSVPSVFWGTQGEYSQWLSLSEILNFEKNQKYLLNFLALGSTTKNLLT